MPLYSSNDFVIRRFRTFNLSNGNFSSENTRCESLVKCMLYAGRQAGTSVRSGVAVSFQSITGI